MPVRTKAIAVLDACVGMSLEDTYVMLVKGIDWDRVRLEANGRCLQLHSDNISDDMDMPCGECLEAALLATETYPDWYK